jgi:hypothetical protein
MMGVAMLTAAIPASAQAGELFGGLYVHDVKTPLNKSGIESGVDLMVGYRAHLPHSVLEPYAFGAVNSAGNTNYAAAGMAARFDLGDRWYIRPGLGIAIHTGSAANYYRSDKIAFGSRVLFEPELGIGTKLDDRLSLEANWIHMSHAQVFGKENPGIDNIGIRLNVRL